MGGLGLITHSEGVGDKNVINARAAFLQFLGNHYPSLKVSSSYFYDVALSQFTVETDSNTTNEMLQNYYSHRVNDLFNELSINPEYSWFAAWFRSNQFKKVRCKWLDPLPPSTS